MSRCKYWAAVFALLVVVTAVAGAAASPRADATTGLRHKLRDAQSGLRQARHRLADAEAALAAAKTDAVPASTSPGPGSGAGDPTLAGPDTSSATPAPAAATVDQLEKAVARARRAVRIWRHKVLACAQHLRAQRQLADWERRGKWMPIIKIAAAKYHVKADGMYRMMMRESGGRRYAGADTAFKGLFQYWVGTWAASWNPWRHDSIYDGSSQISATAYAIHKGYGPSMWTTTWASQY